MKTICHALFALSALLIASCSKQTSDIIEWSTNGVTGVRMPLHVTFVENVHNQRMLFIFSTPDGHRCLFSIGTNCSLYL